MDAILAKQAELAERSLHFGDGAINLSESSLLALRQRVTGERCGLPTRDELAVALAFIEGLSDALLLTCQERDDALSLVASLKVANHELRGVVDSVMRDMA